MRADPNLTKEYRQFCEVSAWRVRAPLADGLFASLTHSGVQPCSNKLADAI